jgi:P4 family phage/plasmid primase-like protien
MQEKSDWTVSPQEIEKALRAVIVDGQVFEVRVLNHKSGKGYSKTLNGYYDSGHIEKAAEDIARLDRGAGGIYYTPNPCKTALLARCANRIEVSAQRSSTSDADILRRHWLLIDLDPDRVSGVSATDEEQGWAFELAAVISVAMTDRHQWPEPIFCSSGNGAQLMYRIDLPADDGGLCERVTDAIARMFDTNNVHIDGSVHNPARIWRVPGTTNRKGDDMPDRPHRKAAMLRLPKKVGTVTAQQMERVVQAAHATEAVGLEGGPSSPRSANTPATATRKPTAYKGGNDSRALMDKVIERLKERGCNAREPQPYQGGVKWALDACPFDSAHTGGSAALFCSDEKGGGFKCQHNSCKGKRLVDVLDLLGIDGRAVKSSDNGKKGGRPKAPCHYEAAKAYYGEQIVKDGVPIIRHYRDGWHSYSSRGWEMISEGEMIKRVMAWLQTKGGRLAEHATKSYAVNLLANLSSFNFCGIPASVNIPCWLDNGQEARHVMAFANGMAVDVWKYAEALAKGRDPVGSVCAVSPYLFSTDFVAYNFDPNAPEPQRFLAYLDRVCPQDDVFMTVNHMMGVLLADVQKYEVFWQLYGKGANGKTVLLDIIEALVGRQNVCRVGLEALSPGTRFQTFPLVTAKVNISGELPTDMGSSSMAAMEGEFKHAVSGGNIEVERKGVDKTLDRCRARFVMSGNSLPTFIDRSEAIWRRNRIIPFDVQIPPEERDPDLARHIIENELPGIFNWALQGLAQVVEMNRIPESSRGETMKAQHRETCDHEHTFLSEKYEQAGAEHKQKAIDLYQMYREWCYEHGYRPKGEGKFKERVLDVFPGANYGTIRINASVAKGYTGIVQKFTP